MSLTVSARVDGRPVFFQHVSMIGALDQAMTLLAAGMSDVVIADGGGQVSTPAIAYQSLFERPAKPAHIGSGVLDGCNQAA
ncbi:hypothetical protein [Methylobacterium symbioticum]|uniref:Uncharacterized protein n=1 Tax=Methylobacterium symbioticum TaxID=2584084 RepID=A0A509EFC6_9HYPH|nr:hypothetical protein [Methylobacterium symbioticum]VUD72304.1 hypothetical protein MET9862_02899 [Methylobacterium symbioticum]